MKKFRITRKYLETKVFEAEDEDAAMLAAALDTEDDWEVVESCDEVAEEVE